MNIKGFNGLVHLHWLVTWHRWKLYMEDLSHFFEEFCELSLVHWERQIPHNHPPTPTALFLLAARTCRQFMSLIGRLHIRQHFTHTITLQTITTSTMPFSFLSPRVVNLNPQKIALTVRFTDFNINHGTFRQKQKSHSASDKSYSKKYL